MKGCIFLFKPRDVGRLTKFHWKNCYLTFLPEPSKCTNINCLYQSIMHHCLFKLATCILHQIFQPSTSHLHFKPCPPHSTKIVLNPQVVFADWNLNCTQCELTNLKVYVFFISCSRSCDFILLKSLVGNCLAK